MGHLMWKGGVRKMEKIHLEEHGIKIVSPVDCENAPKKRFLKELIEAFAVKDIPFVYEYTTEDIYWDIVNDITIQGHEKVVKVLENRLTSRILEIEILNIITHGKTASVNGTVKFEDNSIYSFCNVYTFVSAGKNTIKDITSYVINMD
jgi:hypothetical protein